MVGDQVDANVVARQADLGENVRWRPVQRPDIGQRGPIFGRSFEIQLRHALE
jgi:hypothetical protein